jgi:hypothetical protein
MSNQGTDSVDVMSADSSVQTVELAMDLVYVLPEGARSQDSLQIGAQVRNDGAADSGPFTVRFWLDGTVINDLPFESIAPGQKKWQELEHPALPAGTHKVAAMADFANEIHENNKVDNLGTLDFQVVQMPGVVDFGPGEGEDITVPVVQVGARANAAQDITRVVTNYAMAVMELWTRYSQGLNRFAQSMQHSSASEARFNMDAVAKVAVKKMFDQAVSAITDLAAEVPGVKQGVDLVKSGVEAYFAESERSDKAWSEHEIVVYIENVDREIEKGRTKMRQDIEALAVPLINEFDEVSRNDPQQGNATPGGVIAGGKGGEFLLDLHQKLETFENHMATADDFERAVAQAFAQVASRGGEIQGRLIFHMELYRIVGGFAPSGTDGSIGWTLETAAPGDHSRLAEALTRSLNGKKAWQVELPKTVFLALSSDRGDDPWAKGQINFTDDPATYQITAVDTSNEVELATNTLKDAWDRPSTKELALQWELISA